jgi:TetR/AcrR family transcriptional regulator, regulator of cefoperazone and chloramphenicol sensitivity
VNANAPSNLESDARRGDAARQALIGAGIELFGRRGLEGATTRELARAAGQNIAAIPYHFGSKEGLYLAVAEHLLEDVLQAQPAPDRTLPRPCWPAGGPSRRPCCKRCAT